MSDVFRQTYRELTAEETDHIIALKTKAGELYALLDVTSANVGRDARKVSIAKTKLEESVMWGVKAVTG